jgi:hypothetical protein
MANNDLPIADEPRVSMSTINDAFRLMYVILSSSCPEGAIGVTLSDEPLFHSLLARFTAIAKLMPAQGAARLSAADYFSECNNS